MLSQNCCRHWSCWLCSRPWNSTSQSQSLLLCRDGQLLFECPQTAHAFGPACIWQQALPRRRSTVGGARRGIPRAFQPLQTTNRRGRLSKNGAKISLTCQNGPDHVVTNRLQWFWKILLLNLHSYIFFPLQLLPLTTYHSTPKYHHA